VSSSAAVESVAGRSWWRRRLGGWTWLYLVLTVGSSISAILEPEAQLWQRVLVVVLLPAVVWGVLVRHERPLALPVVALVLLATATDAVLPAAMFSFTLRRPDRRTALVAAVAAAAVVLAFWVEVYPSTMGAGLTFEGNPVPGALERPLQLVADVALLVGLPTLLGAFVAQRRALVASLEDRARRAEEERELRAAQAVAEERRRLAGEMHDVVGHKLALISMQAGALEVNPDVGPDLVEEQATAVRVAAGEAQAELRALLDVVHDDGAPLTPQPGWHDVPALVARARAAGAEVDLTVEVAEEPAPAVGRAVHRIVQEGLTNVLVHAPVTSAEVSVTNDAQGAVVIRMANPLVVPGERGGAAFVAQAEREGAGPASPGERAGAASPAERQGTGLASLAERARVLGGTLEAGPESGRWVLRAVLPGAPTPGEEAR